MMDFVGECMEACSVGDEEGWCLENCHGCHPEMDGDCDEGCEANCGDCKDCLIERHGGEEKQGPRGPKGGKGKGYLLFKGKGDDDMDMPCMDVCDPDNVNHDFCENECGACMDCDDEGNCPDECTQACQDECGECAICMFDAMMDFVGECME